MSTKIPLCIIGIKTRYTFLCNLMTLYYYQLQIVRPKQDQKVAW